MNWSVDLKTRDEWLADYFLWGETPPSVDLVRRKYPKRGSEIEAEALHALLQILRSDEPLSTTIRKRLADLFDPTSSAERHIKIGYRKRGQRTKPWADAHIASYVRFVEKSGGGRDAAVAAAERQFGLARSNIYAALERHEQRLTKRPVPP